MQIDNFTMHCTNIKIRDVQLIIIMLREITCDPDLLSNYLVPIISLFTL